jgi:hypothetical protein
MASASARLDRYCQTKRLELQVRAPELSVGDIQSLVTLEGEVQTLLKRTISASSRKPSCTERAPVAQCASPLDGKLP